MVLLSRKPEEIYVEYIEKIKQNKWARNVKVADITDNLSRPGCSESLRKRYLKALEILGVEKLVTSKEEAVFVECIGDN